jgi:hypothetical protein
MMTLLAVAFGCATLALAAVVVWQLRERARLRHELAGIFDLEHEIASRRTGFETQLAKQTIEIASARQRATQEVADTMRTARELRAQHAAAKVIHDRLRHEVNVLQHASDDLSYGLYEPVFAFTSPEHYKRGLSETREQQRAAVRAGHAIRCKDSWIFGENRKASLRLQMQYGRALLRAFNGECAAAIARVAWNNVTRTIERVKLAFEAINKLGSELQVEITTRYRDLKLDELRLEYELAQKRHDEQEEQREARALRLEELHAQQELEHAREEADAEVLRAQGALDAARDRLAGVQGAELDDQLGTMAALESALIAAQLRAANATAQAQQSRAGHVFVVSNVGSFGDTVYKIGMTRRLDPVAHVRELADAALPFAFDVHAMIRSDDAQALEAKLHRQLRDRRLNLVDPRGTFFQVSLDEIDAAFQSLGITAPLTRAAEAQQYLASNAVRRKLIPPPRLPRAAGSFAFAIPDNEPPADPLAQVPGCSTDNLVARLVPSWKDAPSPTPVPFPEETPIG